MGKVWAQILHGTWLDEKTVISSVGVLVEEEAAAWCQRDASQGLKGIPKQQMSCYVLGRRGHTV